MMSRAIAVPLSLLVFALLFLSGAAYAAQSPAVKKPQVDTPKRILFVGNSYFYYNDSLHNHVLRLAIAGDPSIQKALQYKSATIGGAPLAHHNVKYLLVPGNLGMKQPYDVVILQGNSGDALSDASRASFREKAVEFNGDIGRAGGKTALYMTHAYVEPNKSASPDMIRKVEDMYVSVGNEIGALVLPVGLAFEEAYRRKPDIKLHKEYDGSHPDLIGTYLAACVVYASLYGRSPVGNSYDYYGRINKETATFLQQVAEDTVKKFYGR
jgi:uncharacterized protein DUF4886